MLCDVIIPDATYLEQSRVVADWMYDSFISLGQKAINPMYNCKSVVTIFTELARRLGYGEYFPWKSDEEYLENQMRNQEISLQDLKKVGFHITDPHEYYKYKKWGSVNPPAGYGTSGNSTTGKYSFIQPTCEENGVNAMPDYIDPWQDYPDLQPDAEFPLVLGYFRVLEHEHTSTFWNVSLMKAFGSNPVWINYVDAKKFGIENGDEVIISSPWNETRSQANVTWKIKQGVLASAGGFGRKRGLEGDPKYPQFRGYNTNYLLRPNTACKWTGTPPLKYIKSSIRKA
jgi:thiosulfate reductase/polysulfide reductase chain A